MENYGLLRAGNGQPDKKEYRSHKDAILFAMLKVIERDIDTQLKEEIGYCSEVRDEPFPWKLDIGKAQAHQICFLREQMNLKYMSGQQTDIFN